MKPNVDLTLNRDFRDRNSIKRKFKDVVNSRGVISVAGRSFISLSFRDDEIEEFGESRAPWNNSKWKIFTYNSELGNGHVDTMFTGNKKERAEKKFYNSEYDDTVCYCCGGKIRIPWRGYMRLCKRCNLNNDKKEIEWWSW